MRQILFVKSLAIVLYENQHPIARVFQTNRNRCFCVAE